MSRTKYVGIILTILLALVLIPTVARAEGAPAAPMTEAQFIELAGAEKPGDGAPREPGRPMEPGKPIEEPKKTDDEDSGDDSDSGDAGKGSSDDDGDEAGDEQADDAGEGDGEGEDDDGAEDGEGAGDEQDDAKGPTAEEDAAFKKALADEGVEVKLEDIPEAARPIVAKKLKDLERGFHAKMRELSEDQKAARSFRTEERFRKEHKADFIVAMLLEDPAISDQVNAIVENLQDNATAVEGHKAIVEKARRDAASAEEGEDRKLMDHQKRIDNYIRVGRAAARAAGVPFEAGVEDAMAARLALGEELTEADIRDIARAKGKVYKDRLREAKRYRSERYVKDKTKDRRTAGLRVKPGAGRSPSPGAKKVAQSDAEFVEEFSSRGG